MGYTIRKIKSLIEKEHVSIKDLCLVLKISRPVFYRWEKDDTQITLGALQNISKYFKVPVCDLITEPKTTESQEMIEIGRNVLSVIKETEAKYQRKTKPNPKKGK
jgi:transcriptional regulator with XRE-family HTH domain